MVLEAPPLNTYTSCEQGLQDLYNWSQEQGYGLTIEGTNQTKKKVIKRYRLRCDMPLMLLHRVFQVGYHAPECRSAGAWCSPSAAAPWCASNLSMRTISRS